MLSPYLRLSNFNDRTQLIKELKTPEQFQFEPTALPADTG